jgi:hypothetical protein
VGAVGFTSGDPRKLDRSGYSKGDVLAADAAGDLTPVPVGADTEVLTADSTDPEGVDWQPGGGGGGAGTPSNTVTAETSYGQASNAGAAAAYSRGDHTHGTPSLAGSAPATTLTIGQAAAVGVAATPARADHVHPMASSGTPSTSAVGDAATQGAATTFARSDHTHGREGFAAPADSLVGDTQNAGVAATVARSDHRHARESFGPVTAQTSFGQPSSDGAATSVARSDHTHGTPTAPAIPGAGTTVVAETSYSQSTAVGAATTYAREDHSHGTPALGATASTAAPGNHTHTAAGVGAIPASILDAKGDIVAATAADTPARLPVGSDGQFLRANSATGTGLEWDTVTASDVGADPAGTAAAAVAAHVAAVDPHGDRAYTDAQLAAAALVFDIRKYGAAVNGTTDDSAAVTAAITAAVAAGGGIVFFPAGVCRINSQILLPNDAGGIPKQAPITFLGTGSRWDGRWQGGGDPPGASVLDLRFSGAVAKIDTRGVGVLSMRDLVLTDLGTSSTPFIQTTNTTLFIERCSFYGNPTKSGITTDQDGIVLGGMTTTIDGSATAPFQGYGTIIRGNSFARIRRGVYLRTYANAVVVSENTWSTTCGGDASVGAIDISPLAGQIVAGCVVSNNLIEVVNYVYGVRCDYASNNSFIANNFYDPGAGALAYYRFEANATFNLVIDGYRNDTKPLISETGGAVGTNLMLTSHQSQITRFSQPVEFSSVNDGLRATGSALFSGGTARFVIQPATDQTEGAQLFLVKRSAADDVNPGGEIFRISQDSTLLITNSAGSQTQLTSGGRTWQAVGAGGAMVVNTGTGGSNFDIRAFGARLTHFTSNTELIRFRISPQSATQGAIQFNITGPIDTAGSGSPEGVVTAPVGSIFRRSDGAAGTSIYVKESGAGNTGWVAARLVVGTTAGTVAAGDDSRIIGAQQRSTLTAKGDLYAATAAATVARHPVGADGQVLRAASGQATGLEWDTLDAADVGAVPTARAVNTTAPLAGGGDLSADRTISLNADGVTNTLLANMPANTIKGNNTGGTADPADLTASQVLAMLNIARQTQTWSRDGDATITTGAMRWYNRTGKTLTIHGAWAAAGTAPTGASLIVDVNKNGVTIFTTQANRPTITAGSNGGTLATPDVTTLADGDYLTVDIDQVGSSIAGADVTVGVVMS